MALIFCLLSAFGFSVDAAESNGKEVRVPITIKVPHAIAGAEFEISYTSGLKLLSFEKSDAIRSAATTPIVEKRGKTYFGFYSGSNDYVPTDGVLDVGYMVFSSTGAANQSVTMIEVKYVEVIDKQTTKSTLLTINDETSVPLSSGAGAAGKTDTWRIVLASLVVIVGSAGILYTRRKLHPAPKMTDI